MAKNIVRDTGAAAGITVARIHANAAIKVAQIPAATSITLAKMNLQPAAKRK